MRAALVVGIGCACAWLVCCAATAAAEDKGARLGGLFAEAPRAPVAPGPELTRVAIERALDALAQRADAALVASAIDRGRAALSDARTAWAAGDRDAAERKTRLAAAALALAQRRMAATEAARDVLRAREREQAATADLAKARAALAEAQARQQAAHALESAAR